MAVRLKNFVLEIPTEPAPQALAHFQSKLAHETDCWDVQFTEGLEERGFVLVDVRSADLFAAGHVPGALHIPHSELTVARLSEYPPDMLFVVYCAGPHCNGADKAALRLAHLGRPVKKMIGGVEGWKDEGFDLVTE